jgi:hypothetical protein
LSSHVVITTSSRRVQHITARMCIGASEGASGSAALRRAAPPHGPSPWLGSGSRHIRREHSTGDTTREVASQLFNRRLKDAFMTAARNCVLFNP